MLSSCIFIDGEAGTTGLEIRKRLEGRGDFEMLSIAEDKRKDAAERKRLLNACDVAVLCLPDEAAREAVALIDNPKVKVLDASTAHRVAEGWVYGFPEMAAGQREAIRSSKRVSNPGCYATGAIAMIRPLVDAGIMSPDMPVTINAVSGYSGGGKELIAVCENPETAGQGRGAPYCLYGLDQKHKHLPEIQKYGRLSDAPVFLPSYVNNLYRGMLAQMALRGVDGLRIQEVLTAHYAGQETIVVEPLEEPEKGFVLTPLGATETNKIILRVFWNRARKVVVVTAVLDNLGKGASGAAVQNLEIMAGKA
ncbi:MAG: N-acetyl-gamma-glutamyl-phosphate reductase [Bdellovibrionales bacterium]